MRFIEFKIRSFGLLENMEGHFPAGLSLSLEIMRAVRQP